MEPRKEAICDALARWIKQRPGLEYGNYGDRASYTSECRGIARDKREAETLLAAVRWRDGINADALIKAARDAFSGRLTIRELEWKQYAPEECPGKPCSTDCDHRQFRGFAVDYCTGQYFPTEYRKAACAVLASALREYARANMPAVVGYRVESWSQLGKGRTRHTIVAHRAAAELQLTDLGGQDYGSVSELYPGNLSAGDWLRTHFLREFGRGIAGRWFR